jgi:hypothetical protein
MTYLLQIGVPDALGFIICVADIVTDMRRFAAKFTYSAHESGSFRTRAGDSPF